MRFAVMMLALVAFTAAAQTADAVYAEGKALYDAKQYAAALEKFDECARLEPTTARWQYNRGLALRKLKRDEESRSAFLSSLALDPTYKQKEIREKLGDLAPAPTQARDEAPAAAPTSDSSDGNGGLFCLGWVVLGVVFQGALWLRRRWKRGAASGAATKPGRAPGPMDEGTRRQLQGRLAGIGQTLTRLEHAMSLGEDAQARANLDRGFTNFQQARRTLAGGKNVPDEVTSALDRAEAAARNGEQRLRALRGEAYDSAQGPAAGCFFCARPLPTPESRQVLAVQVRAQQTPVAACSICARRVAAGDAPAVTMVQGQHWATVAGIDPYVFAYSGVAPLQEAPAWQLTRDAADVGQLASLAGAAAVGAVAGVAVSRLLDVDALSESAVASDAAEAAARAASSRREERDWKDHS